MTAWKVGDKMKASKKNLKISFDNFIIALGGKFAKSDNDVGGYKLDYNLLEKGYQIQQIRDEFGNVDAPFDSEHKSISKFMYALSFAMKALNKKSKNNIQYKIQHELFDVKSNVFRLECLLRDLHKYGISDSETLEVLKKEIEKINLLEQKLLDNL